MATAQTLDVDRAVSLFHALSDPIRLSIMELTARRRAVVCDLQDDLEAAQSKLSFHLKVLKDAGLVRTGARAAGRTTRSFPTRWPKYTILRWA